MQIIYDGMYVQVWEFVFRGLNIGKWNTGKHCDGAAVKKNVKTIVSKRWQPSFKAKECLSPEYNILFISLSWLPLFLPLLVAFHGYLPDLCTFRHLQIYLQFHSHPTHTDSVMEKVL